MLWLERSWKRPNTRPNTNGKRSIKQKHSSNSAELIQWLGVQNRKKRQAKSRSHHRGVQHLHLWTQRYLMQRNPILSKASLSSQVLFLILLVKSPHTQNSNTLSHFHKNTIDSIQLIYQYSISRQYYCEVQVSKPSWWTFCSFKS